MCFKLQADSLLLNYFQKNTDAKTVTLRCLQDKAQEIVKACHYSIVADINCGVVADAARRYSDFVRFNKEKYEIEKLITSSADETKLKTTARLAKEFMPSNVRAAMESVLGN